MEIRQSSISRSIDLPFQLLILEPRGAGSKSVTERAAWHRMHAVDPQWSASTIPDTDASWERWSSWVRGDRRWNVVVIDTTEITVEQMTKHFIKWFDDFLAQPTMSLSRDARWWE